MEKILQAIKDSLEAVVNPRFYATERGFQGEFGAELKSRLSDLEIDGAIVEHEYQKRIDNHGFRIRPDIIIHIPFEGSEYSTREEGNFVVIELKHQANEEKALSDYEHLSSMCKTLNYPLGVFININAKKTYFNKYNDPLKKQLRAFSVHLDETGTVVITP